MDRREEQKSLDELLLDFLIENNYITEPKTTLEDNIRAIRGHDFSSNLCKNNTDYSHFTRYDLEESFFEFEDGDYGLAIQYILNSENNTYNKDTIENFINGIRNGENTAANMTVNTQATSQRKPQPVPPAQPVQPAQEQNTIPTLYQESTITLDEITRTSLESALSYMIEEDKAKRYLIYFEDDCINYFDGKLEQQTPRKYGDAIYLINEKQEDIDDLQSYFNEGKTIYCYNLKQKKYIGHFKKTEKGVDVFQNNEGPTQSQEQPKEQTNAKSQPTEPTQPQPAQPAQPAEPVQPAQPAEPVPPTQPPLAERKSLVRPSKDRQDAAAKEQRQQAEQIKQSICKYIKALTQNTTVEKIQVYTGEQPPSNYAYQLKYLDESGNLSPVTSDAKLCWLVKNQKHIYISHNTKGQEVSQNTEVPEELYAHFYYEPPQNSSNSRNGNQITCNKFGSFNNSDALHEYLKLQFQTNSPAQQEQPVQPTQNFERRSEQSPQSEQPLQPAQPVPPTQPLQSAQEQNPVSTSSQKSEDTLDEATQATLNNVLSNLIQDKSAKRYRIYFGENNKQIFDYYSGNEDQKRTFAPYSDSIYLRNDEGKNVEDLQSYLNNGKTIYCYNLKQKKYIGHFKKTEKGISPFQSNKGPTQSKKQPKEQTNAKSQPTESTKAMQQTSSSEPKQQIEQQDPQEQPTPTTSMPTQQELIKTPLDSDETNVDNKQELLQKLQQTNSLKRCFDQWFTDIKEINFVNKGRQSYLSFSVEDEQQSKIQIIFDQNYKNINEAIQNVANFSSVNYTSLPFSGVIATNIYKKKKGQFEWSETEMALTQDKQEELTNYLKNTYDINLENTNCDVELKENEENRCFHIKFSNNGQNYKLEVNNDMYFSTRNAILYQVNENGNSQVVHPIKETICEILTTPRDQAIDIRQADTSSLGNTSYTVTQFLDNNEDSKLLYSVIKEKDKEIFYVTKYNDNNSQEYYVLKKEGEEYKRYEIENYIYNLLSERFPDTFNKNATTELQSWNYYTDTVTFAHNDKNYSINIPDFKSAYDIITPFTFCSILNRPGQFECKCTEIEKDNEIDVMQSTTEPEPMVLGTSQTPIIQQIQPEQQKLLSDSVSTQNTFDIMGSTSHNPEETHQNSTSLEKSENFDPVELHKNDTDLEKSGNFDPVELHEHDTDSENDERFDPVEVKAEQAQRLIEQITLNQTTEDIPEIPTYNPWPKKVRDELEKQNVEDFEVQEDKYICKVGQTVCVLCTKGDSNDYQPYDRQTKLDNLEQLYLVEQDGDRLTNVKLSLQKKQNWKKTGYSQWTKNNFYWKITESEIIPNTIPQQNMKDNKSSSSKTTDITSSDKETENKISVTRSKNWSAPVQTNQRLLRPQQPLQRPQRPRRPQVVQAEIIPTVPPVQNLNEHVNDTGFDPVEASESNTDIIKQDALLMSLNTTTPPLNSQLI